MTIIFQINEFLYELFPVEKNNLVQLKEYLNNFYTDGPFEPKIEVSESLITIDVDTSKIIEDKPLYEKLVNLCEKGNFKEAKSLAQELIQKSPNISEYHRVLGQILSELGNQEGAINCLIDALRWNPKNEYALLMMGNIFSKYKQDIDTAIKYYNQVLIVNPNENITINNIAANLMQLGKLEEAKKYFWEALRIDNNYPNSHFALGMIAEQEEDFSSAFYSTIQAIKLNKAEDVLLQNSVKQAFSIANKIAVSDIGSNIYKDYLAKLVSDGGKEIGVIADSNIPTAAKFEFAENYNRAKHIVKYKPNYPAIEHLIMHELVHLDFVIEARKKDVNQLFISNQNHKSNFINDIGATSRKLTKMGVSKENISNYCSGLFDGINSQTFNTPIDLFIENFLYEEFAELRPYQFLSLFNMIQESVKAVTDKKVLEVSPSHIISKSKIYNLLNAIQFKSLYGVDLIKDFKASKSELTLANDFYKEFLEYKDDKEAGEEYELLLHWAEDLKLEKNFELVEETKYRKGDNVDDFIDDLEKDPFGLNEENSEKVSEMETFQKSQADIGLNMAVVMFMVDALQFFENQSKEEIKKIAFEIAMQGTQGYNPENKDYRISAIKGKLFSGYHILSYYYVSWSLAIPEMLSQLHLPYDEEYKLARTIHKKK
ncbi:tetratricopeptide repeat protein [Polaribacter sp. NJDZ03]|uniref:tetratricopeptide repeat protein n=1 Tax=Polaribacter sp. NJDZ03 TaxID=2855841 RepID=UPI001C4A72F5|nr:tetratricopeptide repeat protein [Polaribacter sp. NJDZ03]